ncbi:hypothetical protein B0J12DRAFT_83393 [Macrophomina phaseolina]|uniref:25S rRNA (uridine-N(3))-methyltransferase BMT5-like domain-containing protein n=1 Tax=Macrophomina phaseolina TaxID=35725 RepID=A0ABQ8GC54_9PEZI|nr:hypothetical protein B0J12DRAFT_83393 [Macrophomina phaseolina]
MARKKSKPWLEKGRANRLAGTPCAGTKRAATANTPKQSQNKLPEFPKSQPPKKKQKKPAASPAAATTTAEPPNTTTSSSSSYSAADAPPAAYDSAKASAATPTTIIPFDPNERILLVGDGDFSFARSIVEHHGCADVLATSYDDRDTLLQKYPQAAANIAYLEAEGQRVAFGVDATKLGACKEVKKGGMGDGLVEEREAGGGRSGGWDRIIFNFPHVGGKSTDVNRQVRYNQELLVSFFTSALPHLSPHPAPASPVSAHPTILVTLFEGEPYTLWNIKDLARHVGLRVQRSFRFRADAYPGYKHARTLGNVEGERGGKWRGEEREARTFIFEAGDAAAGKANGRNGADGAAAAGKKRKKGGDESESDDD